MRISTSMIYDIGVASMQQSRGNQIKLQEQLSSGLRVLTPSDDPVAAAAALDIKQSQALNSQLNTNGDSAKSLLIMEESALADATALLQDVKTFAVYAGNPTLTNSDRASIATELNSRYRELLGIANRGDGNGQYLFSGYQGATKPFSETGPGKVAYAGDSGQRLTQIGTVRTIAVNDSGDSIFRAIKNGNGIFATAGAAANTGGGIIDTGIVTDPSKWNSAANPRDFTIRFSQNMDLTAGATNAGDATAVGGVVNQTQWDAGSEDYTIVFNTPPNTYNIKDTATGVVVQSGGAYSSGATISFMGAEVVITDGPGLVGPAAGDTFRFVPSVPPGLSYDIIDNVNNVSLLTGAAPGAAPYLRTYVPGGTISLATQSPPDTNATPFDFGATVAVSGAVASGDTFMVKASTNQDIFSMLQGLITALQTGTSASPASVAAYQDSLNAAMSYFDNALSNVLRVRADVGTRLREVGTAQSTSEGLSLQYSTTLSGLQDLDYAKAASDLSMQQVYLQAAQQSFMKITSLNLFSLL